MLNNFFECPWKWYFRNLLKLPEPLTESLHVGNVTHKTIEFLLRQKNEITEASIATHITDCALIEARFDDALAGRIAREVQGIIAQWRKLYAVNIAAIHEVEKKFTTSQDPQFPHLTITGTIDLVETIEANVVRVTDWKTGAPKSANDIEKTDEEGRMSGLLRQLAMYSYLIEGTSKGATEIDSSQLIFLEAKANDAKAIYQRHIQHSDIDALRTDIADYDRALKTGDWVYRPCAFKSYGGEECPYCARAKMIYNINTL